LTEPSSSTATIVFTEMVGSGALRARLGEERAEEVRRLHDDVLTARIEANGGQVLKGQGDGLVAAFPSACDALTAAVQMQQAMASHNRRGNAVAEVSIRIGLSVGDVSWEEGDCFGTPLVEAARLEATAGSGQILCSEFVRMMARNRGGHEFVDLGFLELKGLPEPVATCEVVWAPVPEPVAAALPLPSGVAQVSGGRFVSRSRELRLGERALTDPARQRLGLLWLLGEPGIGKTRLASEIARRAHALGAVVLFGRCGEDLSAPYQPFVEALAAFIDEVPAAELPARLGDAPGELTRLVPQLAHRVPGLAAHSSAGPELDQHRLFEAVGSWLASAGGDRPVLAVFDDVHWAARPTLQMLGHVARSTGPSRALLVCTARNTSPDDNEELAALAEELDRRGVASHRLELGGLGFEAVAVLVERAAGRQLDDRLRSLAARVHSETAGNPLFVDALLAAVGNSDGELPRTVNETVHRRVGRLPAPVADLLHTASVAGLDFDLPVVARAAGRDELDVLDALETAERAGLVVEAGADRYRFTHALVRAALRDDLSQSRRVRIHLRIGEALEAVHAAALDEHADALAYHFSEAAPAGGAEKAFSYTVAAAQRAVRLLAHADAAAAYRRAVELLPAVPGEDPLARCELLLAQAGAHDRAGDFAPGRQAARAAFEEASAADSPDHLVRAAIAFESASFKEGLVEMDVLEAVELLERVEAVVPVADSTRRAMVEATLGRGLLFRGRQDESAERGRTAVAMAQRLGDPATLGEVLVRSGFFEIAIERAPAMATRAREILALADQLGDGELWGWGAFFGMWSSLQLGDLGTCDVLLSEYLRQAERMNQPLWNDWAPFWRHLRAMMAGDLELAERSLRQWDEHTGRWGTEGIHGMLTFLLRREQGRLGSVAPALREIVRLRPGQSFWPPGLVALYAELGMLEEARSEFDSLAAGGFVAISRGGGREIALGFAAEACVALGDAERAEELFRLLGPCRGKVLVAVNQASLGPADRLLGLLAAIAGRTDEADLFFDNAIDFCRRMPSPLWLAHCLYDAARHVAQDDPERAESMRDEASAICEQHGLAGLAQKLATCRR
jgi:class 3 adenylate cyclase/tetratricopeptide (TPR) repeat protein